MRLGFQRGPFKAHGPREHDGVPMKVTEEVKEGGQRVIYMDDQSSRTDHLTEILKPKSLLDGGG